MNPIVSTSPPLQRFACVIGAFIAIGAGACTPPFYAVRTRPAEIDLRDIKRVALYGIGGDDGPALESAIAQGLVASHRFDVLDRAHLEQLQTETQKFHLDPAVPASFRKLGAILPASAIITGKVLDSSYRETTGFRESSCPVVNGSKVEFQPCIVHTRLGTLNYTADIKLISIETGAVLAARKLSSSASKSTEAAGGEPEGIDQAALLTTTREQAAEQFLRLVAPFTVQELVDFESDGDLKELEYGNRYLRAGDLESAIEMYRDAVERADRHAANEPRLRAKAHYSLALGLALSGEYDLALEEIKQANFLSGEAKWLEFEARIKTWKAESERLKQQGTEDTVASTI